MCIYMHITLPHSIQVCMYAPYILCCFPCILQVMIVLEFLHKGDLREFLRSLKPQYV